MEYFEYRGHLHIHSSYSDGGAGIPEIARAAEKAGLDFIGITDHNNLEGLRRGVEGWHGKVLVLIGTEINVTKNHYIAFGVREEIPPCDEDPQQVIDAVNAQGGFGYLAHPTEKGNPFFMDGRCYPWDKLDVRGFTGLEFWNFGSQWRLAYTRKLKALFWRALSPYSAGSCPDPEAIKLWDRLSRKQPVVGFGGSDAHRFQGRLGPLKISFFPYEFLFKTVNVHLVLPEKLKEDGQEAKEQVYGALRKGMFFIASDYLHPPGGFRFAALNEKNEEVLMGGRIAYSPSTVLKIKSPSSRGQIRIIKNGQLVYKSREQVLAFKVLKPGTFRVEVHWQSLLGRLYPWIYSNPIYVV